MRKLFFIALIALYTPFPEHACAQIASGHKPETLVFGALLGKTATGVAHLGQTAPTPASQVDFTWSYTPTLSPCTTVLRNCYDGFTMTYTNTETVIATQSTLRPAALSYNWVPTDGVPYGSLNFALVANGYDDFGDPIASKPAAVTVTNDVTSLAAPSVLPSPSGVAVQ